MHVHTNFTYINKLSGIFTDPLPLPNAPAPMLLFLYHTRKGTRTRH
jgi:hypothetical protein